MRPFMISLVGIFILLAAIVQASDVAYIVTELDHENPDFVSVLDELDLNYTLILSSDVASYDFSEFKLILVNNEDFDTESKRLAKMAVRGQA